MAIDKKSTIGAHQVHKKDTGSAQVQIALMTERIRSLTEHLKEHKKDKHSRYGLMKIIGARRGMLRYLKMKDKDGYKSLVEKLGIRA